jgi:hypothetical protein
MTRYPDATFLSGHRAAWLPVLFLQSSIPIRHHGQRWRRRARAARRVDQETLPVRGDIVLEQEARFAELLCGRVKLRYFVCQKVSEPLHSQMPAERASHKPVAD